MIETSTQTSRERIALKTIEKKGCTFARFSKRLVDRMAKCQVVKKKKKTKKKKKKETSLYPPPPNARLTNGEVDDKKNWDNRPPRWRENVKNVFY